MKQKRKEVTMALENFHGLWYKQLSEDSGEKEENLRC
jgi:hypothetical protein